SALVNDSKLIKNKGANMLKKQVYTKVMKRIESLKKQDERDRKEMAGKGLLPIGWESSVLMIVQDEVRNGGDRYTDNIGKEFLNYLVQKGILVEFFNSYRFPFDEKQLKEEVLSELKKNAILN